MENQAEAPQPPVETPAAPAEESFSSVSEAAKILRKARVTPSEEAPAPEEPKEEEEQNENIDALPPEEYSVEAEDEQDTSASDDAPSEHEDGEAPEAEPLKPPRAWSKESWDVFESLPRDIQEAVVENERQREKYHSERQAEATQQRQEIEKRMQEAEQVRQQYEAVLPQLLHQMQQQSNAEFADIQTQDDVMRLARENPARYTQWHAHQTQMQAVQQEFEQSQAREYSARSEAWQSFAQEQDDRFFNSRPEMSDPEKAKEIKSTAKDILNDMGFSDQEIRGHYEWGFLRDHRVQSMLADMAKYKIAEKRVKVKAKKEVPPVMKPGAKTARSVVGEGKIKALDQKLEQTHSAKDAAALLMARRANNRKR